MRYPCCNMYQNLIPFKDLIIFLVCIYYLLFIHLLGDIWVVFSFWLLWIMLLWTLVYKYLFESLFSILFWHIPRSGIAGSYDNSIISNSLRNRQLVFNSRCTILHSHQQCARVPLSSHSHKHLLFSGVFLFVCFVVLFCFLFYDSHPNECEVLSFCILICISLMTNNVEHLFMYLLAICISWWNV